MWPYILWVVFAAVFGFILGWIFGAGHGYDEGWDEGIALGKLLCSFKDMGVTLTSASERRD